MKKINNLAFAFFNNRISVYDNTKISNNDNNNYKTLAYISTNRVVTFIDTLLTKSERFAIEHYALFNDDTISFSQTIKIFKTKPYGYTISGILKNGKRFNTKYRDILLYRNKVWKGSVYQMINGKRKLLFRIINN